MANLETQRNLDEANRGTALQEAQAKKAAEDSDAAAKSAEELAKLIHAPYQYKKEMEKLRTDARKDRAAQQGLKADKAWNDYMDEVNKGMNVHGYDNFTASAMKVLMLQTKLGLALQEGFYHMTDTLIAGDYVPEPLREFAQNYIPDAPKMLSKFMKECNPFEATAMGIQHFTAFNDDNELVLTNLKYNNGWFELDKDYPVSLETVLAFQAEVVGFLHAEGYQYREGTKGQFETINESHQLLTKNEADTLLKLGFNNYLEGRLTGLGIEFTPLRPYADK